jgi:hypothetical protein
MMKTLLAALLLSLAIDATAADPKPAKVKPEDVKVTSEPDEVEFCQKAGPVKAKSGWGGTAGSDMGRRSVEATLKKRAAALGGNVVLLGNLSTAFTTEGNGEAYFCSEDALNRQQVRAAEVAAKAAATITCTAGTDCEVRWGRVTTWLQENSSWKFRNVTETLITTEGPLETVKPAFEVTKMPVGDGKTYKIAMRAFCGVDEVCDKLIVKLRALFYDAITAPIEVPATTP